MKDNKTEKSILHILKQLVILNEAILPQTLKSVHDLFERNNIDYCFIGGIILPFYNYSRTTKDIDILINIDDKEKFLNLIPPHFTVLNDGLTKDKANKFTFNKTKAEINTIYSRQRIGNSQDDLPYEDPKDVSIKNDGINILSLPKLIEYKLSAFVFGRKAYRDLGDVQELIRNNDLSFDWGENLNSNLRWEYEEIYRRTFL